MVVSELLPEHAPPQPENCDQASGVATSRTPGIACADATEHDPDGQLKSSVGPNQAVTVPVPRPSCVTARTCGVGSSPKTATQLTGPVTVTVVVAVCDATAHSSHRAKSQPSAGVALSVTVVGWSNVVHQPLYVSTGGFPPHAAVTTPGPHRWTVRDGMGRAAA